MKKLLILLLLLGFVISYSQETNEFYHDGRVYSYTTFQDAELLKIKTEGYILDMKAAGCQIIKNEITHEKIDIDVQIPIKTGKIRFTVVYLFLERNYYVDLFGPKYYLLRTKKWYDINDKGDITTAEMETLDFIKKIVFKTYQNEMNSNF